MVSGIALAVLLSWAVSSISIWYGVAFVGPAVGLLTSTMFGISLYASTPQPTAWRIRNAIGRLVSTSLAGFAAVAFLFYSLRFIRPFA